MALGCCSASYRFKSAHRSNGKNGSNGRNAMNSERGPHHARFSSLHALDEIGQKLGQLMREAGTGVDEAPLTPKRRAEDHRVRSSASDDDMISFDFFVPESSSAREKPLTKRPSFGQAAADPRLSSLRILPSLPKVPVFTPASRVKPSGQPLSPIQPRAPLIEIFNEKDHVIVVATLSGVSKDDVIIALSDGECVLTLRHDTSFKLTARLPVKVSGAPSEIMIRNGILSLTLTKIIF
jgi:HSP20 family molecular chaperone IbpA